MSGVRGVLHQQSLQCVGGEMSDRWILHTFSCLLVGLFLWAGATFMYNFTHPPEGTQEAAQSVSTTNAAHEVVFDTYEPLEVTHAKEVLDTWRGEWRLDLYIDGEWRSVAFQTRVWAEGEVVR